MRSVDYDGDGLIDEEVLSIPDKELKNFVIDVDQNGQNDITGESYSSSDIQGHAYGQDNATGRGQTGSESQASDNANQGSTSRGNGLGRSVDRFIDLDGDGIADDRQNNRLKNSGRGKGR